MLLLLRVVCVFLCVVDVFVCVAVCVLFFLSVVCYVLVRVFCVD